MWDNFRNRLRTRPELGTLLPLVERHWPKLGIKGFSCLRV